jgi:hypothetical protein
MRVGGGLILVHRNLEVETYIIFAKVFLVGYREASIIVIKREEVAREEAGGVELPSLVAL